MTTVEQEMRKTDRMVNRLPKPALHPKKVIDWRAEFNDEWDYHGIIYTLGATLAWTVIVSGMFGFIYGGLIMGQI